MLDVKEIQGSLQYVLERYTFLIHFYAHFFYVQNFQIMSFHAFSSVHLVN